MGTKIEASMMFFVISEVSMGYTMHQWYEGNSWDKLKSFAYQNQSLLNLKSGFRKPAKK